MNDNEMRLDPLRRAWTVFSPARAVKPPLPGGAPNRVELLRPSPFSAGNESMASHALYTSGTGGNWRVRVVPNRVPALRVEGRPGPVADGFYDRMEAVGAHEIIIESPGAESLESLSAAAVGEVITAWKIRMIDLWRDVRLRSFFILKNAGTAAGATVNHSISQLVAMAVVAPSLRTRLEVALDFYARKGRSIFGDILGEEIRVAKRLVYENNGFAVFCPYASRVPFELAIMPKRQCPDFHGITDQETAQFADALRTALRKLKVALDTPPYHLTLFTAPSRTPRRDQWNTLDQDFRWHLEIGPRLFYTDAFETGTGCHINTVLPETAAEYLRKIEP